MDLFGPGWAGMDLYAELSVGRSATSSEIHAAYRRLARRFHPDLHPADPAAAERFRRLATAYSVLSDTSRRAMYDRVVAGGPRATRVAPPPARPAAGAARSAAPPVAHDPTPDEDPAPPDPPTSPTDEARNLGRLALALAVGIALLIATIALVSAIGPYCGGSAPPPTCVP